MKKLFGILALLLLALLIYSRFYNAPTRPSQEISPAAHHPTATGATVGDTSATTPAFPGEVTPSGMPALASPMQTILPRMQSAAAQHGVSIQNIQFTGKNVPITLDWVGDVATTGMDFVDQLLRDGIIRDFEEAGGGRRWFDAQGRSHFTQSLVLKLP